MQVELIVALGLGVVAAGLAVFGYLSRKKRWRMQDTPTLSVVEMNQALGLRAELHCEAVGVAQPGAGGPVRGPFSGTACVWHRTTVTRHYEKWEYNSQTKRRERRRRQQQVADERSPAPFRLQDDSGLLTLAPAEASVDGAVKSFDRYQEARDGHTVQLGPFSFRAGGGGTLGYTYREWIITPGTRLYALGQVVRQGPELVMAKPEGQEFVVSTRSEAEITKGLHIRERIGFIGAAVAAAGGAVAALLPVFG
ncbi:GIDE domain-containing protein [Allonocardiopsis opalescens]|uniref:RING-type E3 ubiquitin transferase n=1 Tax=Allonocardiopsis opalescens TaxID=1144618 RepID=A0A2T0QAC7_9ACTN|nr:GIDE domain-containing protein [Allonocardiopsis opalescens]PRY00770.1 E3 ubiquitin ligase [Allonocardiopsis opalescens]